MSAESQTRRCSRERLCPEDEGVMVRGLLAGGSLDCLATEGPYTRSIEFKDGRATFAGNLCLFAAQGQITAVTPSDRFEPFTLPESRLQNWPQKVVPAVRLAFCPLAM